MAINDRIVFNSFERAQTNDLNQLQQLHSRQLAEIIQYANVLREVDSSSTEQISPRSFVVGGLSLSPSGADITIGPGVLAQYSTTLSPVPGALDSNMRIGVNRSATTLTGPGAPGADTWYVIEAQVVENVTLNESRDIFNPVTETFSPANIDKRVEYSVAFQLRTGTSTAIPSAMTDWVPIGVAFRANGAGTWAADQVRDYRLTANDISAGAEQVRIAERYSLQSYTEGLASYNAHFDVRVRLNGQNLYFYTKNNPINLIDERIASPSIGAFAADTWYYVYLGSINGKITKEDSPTFYNRGKVVVSRVAPDPRTKTNSAAIALPEPFVGTNAPIGSMAFVGAFLNDTAGTAWVRAHTDQNGLMSMDRADVHMPLFSLLYQTGVSGGAAQTLNLNANGGGGTEFFPYGCDGHIHMGTILFGGTPTDAYARVMVTDGGSREFTTNTGHPLDLQQPANYRFPVPSSTYRSFSIEVDSYTSGGTNNGNDLTGWNSVASLRAGMANVVRI